MNQESIFFKLNLAFIIVLIIFALFALLIYKEVRLNLLSTSSYRLRLLAQVLHQSGEIDGDNYTKNRSTIELFVRYFDRDEPESLESSEKIEEIIDDIKKFTPEHQEDIDTIERTDLLTMLIKEYDFQLMSDESTIQYILQSKPYRRSLKKRKPPPHRHYKENMAPHQPANRFLRHNPPSFLRPPPYHKRWTKSDKRHRIFIYDRKPHLYIDPSLNATPSFNTTPSFNATSSWWLITDEQYEHKMVIFYGIMMGLLAIWLSLYLMLKKTFLPIKSLIAWIHTYGQEGRFAYPYADTKMKQDEISRIGNELYIAIDKMDKMAFSKRFFMRNLMHELKTPITKGKLSVSLMQEDDSSGQRYTDMLAKVFDRLEYLIDQLTQMEKLSSHDVQLQTTPHSLKNMIEEAKELLMISDEVIYEPSHEPSHSDDEMVVVVDRSLFVVALKNLIDNGIKYASDNRVRIIYKDKKILFINRGEPLDYPFEQYVEPFFKGSLDGSNIKSSGLGLYIVQTIMQKHDFKLSHHYQDGKHYFGVSV